MQPQTGKNETAWKMQIIMFILEKAQNFAITCPGHIMKLNNMRDWRCGVFSAIEY